MQQFKRGDQVQFKNSKIFPGTLTVERYYLETSHYLCFYFTKPDQNYQEARIHEDLLKPWEDRNRGKMTYR